MLPYRLLMLRRASVSPFRIEAAKELALLHEQRAAVVLSGFAAAAAQLQRDLERQDHGDAVENLIQRLGCESLELLAALGEDVVIRVTVDLDVGEAVAM